MFPGLGSQILREGTGDRRANWVTLKFVRYHAALETWESDAD